MPVCASTHSLDAIRRPGCDGHRPPSRPPANACCATTGWMPWGPATWVRCPSCPLTPDGWRTLRAFGRTRTRSLPLRRRTPYPLGHESVVSSAVPTAVHGPDTRRAWNRTTNRDRHHNPFAAPHPIRAGAAPPHRPLSYQYSQPAVCTTGSQCSPALDSCLRRDSNPRPSAPEADALSTGPRRQSATYPA